MHKLIFRLTIPFVLFFLLRQTSARTTADLMENQLLYSTEEKIFIAILRATDCESDYKIKVFKKNKKFACFNIVRSEVSQPEDDEPFDISAFKH